MMQAVEYTRVTIGIWRYSCRIVWYAIVHPKTSRNTQTRKQVTVGGWPPETTTARQSSSPYRPSAIDCFTMERSGGGGEGVEAPFSPPFSWLRGWQNTQPYLNVRALDQKGCVAAGTTENGCWRVGGCLLGLRSLDVGVTWVGETVCEIKISSPGTWYCSDSRLSSVVYQSPARRSGDGARDDVYVLLAFPAHRAHRTHRPSSPVWQLLPNCCAPGENGPAEWPEIFVYL